MAIVQQTIIRKRLALSVLMVGGVSFGIAVVGIGYFFRSAGVKKYTCPTFTVATLAKQMQPSGVVANNVQLANAKLKRVNVNVALDADQQLGIVHRKVAMQKLMMTDPRSAIILFAPATLKQRFTKNATNCLERLATVTGKINVTEVDTFQELPSQRVFSLITNEGVVYNIFPSKENPQLSSGSVATVTGLQLDSIIAFNADPRANVTTTESGFTVVESAPDESSDALSADRTLLVLANYRNSMRPALTKLEAQSAVDQARAYYVTNSYNQVQLSGLVDSSASADVVGWMTLGIDDPGCAPYVSPDMLPALEAAKNSLGGSIDLRQYKHIVWLSNFGGCWGGLGTVGPNVFSTPDGTTEATQAWVDVGTAVSVIRTTYNLTHELGHNFGSSHARRWSCPGTIDISSPTCTSIEYGDIYDVMGYRSEATEIILPELNAMHRIVNGWLPVSQVTTVLTSGRYSIEPMETSSTGTKALKIRRAQNDALYIEYRQPLGFDANISVIGDKIYSGALLHFYQISPSRLITPHIFGSTLPVGQTFRDPATNTTITTVSATATALTVDISVGQVDFPPESPVVAITSPAAGSTVSGTITLAAQATSSAGISRVDYYWIPNYAGVSVAASATLSPFAASLDTTRIPNGTVYLIASATDIFGQTGWTVGPGKVLQVANADSAPPSDVRIQLPASGGVFTVPPDITASAFDNIGIHKIEFYKDNDEYPFDVSYREPFVSFGQLPEGIHTVYVRAYDFVGNMTQSVSVTLTVDSVVPTASLSAPAEGSVVSGITRIIVKASDNLTLAQVVISVDQNVIASFAKRVCERKLGVGYCGYFVDWNSVSVANGTHTITAQASDFAGNSLTTEPISIVIQNTQSGGGMKRIPIKVE